MSFDLEESSAKEVEKIVRKTVSPRRILIWIAVMLAVIGLAVLLVWSQGAERRTIGSLPDGERHALFVRTMQNIGAVCTSPTSALRSYCQEQAKFLLNFSECDSECEKVAIGLLSDGVNPR